MVQFPTKGRWACSRVVLVSSLALLLALVTGCDARAREARSGLSDADAARFDRGRRASTPCWACHDFYTPQHKVGPSLAGVFGRPAGTLSGFGHSPAMRASGVVWTDATLDAFLANVGGYVPGTAMASPNVGSSAERAALIFYMRRVNALD